MKKIFSIFSLVLLALCVCFAFCACNDDGDSVSGQGCQHEFEEKELRAATCTEGGVKANICKLCKQSGGEWDTAPLGHDKVLESEQLPSCTQDGYAYYNCQRCGLGGIREELKSSGHNYSYYVTNAPKEDSEGSLNYECTKCSSSGSITLPVLTDARYTKTVIDDENADYTYTYNGSEFKFRISAFTMYRTSIPGLKFYGYVLTGYTGTKTEITLPSTYEGLPVIEIAPGAFDGNEALVSVTIPEPTFTYGVDDMEDAPEGMDPAAEFKMGYQWIGYDAFRLCTELTTVKLPSTLTYIDTEAFMGCAKLSSINLNYVTYIGNDALCGCDGLTSLELPLVRELGTGVFESCDNLKSVSFGSLTTLGARSFYACQKLTDVSLGSKVTEIKDLAFAFCYGLKSITIPDSVEKVYTAIFKDCDALENITMPKIYWGRFASLFSGTCYSGMSYSDMDSTKVPALKSITITKETEVPANAFYSCTRIEKVVLPENTTSIGNQAFASCLSLREFYIPEGIQSIGRYAFDNVNAFNFNQDFDNKTYYIGTKNNPYFYLLCGDANSVSGEYSHVKIQDSCKYVATNAFSYCSNMTAITIPSGMKYLGQISDKSGITNDQTLDIYFKGTLEEFTELHCSCSGWYKRLHIANGSGGFTEVTRLVISSEVTELLSGEYSNYMNLTEIEIPASVKKFDYSVFYPSSFTKVYYNGTIADWCDIEFANDAATPMQSASEFYIKNGDSSYTKVTDIKVPDGVEKLNPFAFYGFNELRTLVIPASVETISGRSYLDIASLTAIYYGGTKEAWDNALYEPQLNDTVPKYFYSETRPALEQFILGTDATLWHYNDSDEPELWSESRGNTVNGKSYVYASSTVSVSDQYWYMLEQLKSMGMLESMFDNPDDIALIENSSTKTEYEAALVNYYATWGNGLTLSFANGVITLSQNSDSTELEYLELDGGIYYILTGSLAFTIAPDGNSLIEDFPEINDEYMQVVHTYNIVTA